MAERGRPRSFDRETALRQAMEIFWERGYEGTSLADLMVAMKINAPSLYAAFGGKEALFREAVDYYRSTDGSATGKALRAGLTARAAIEGMLMAAAIVLALPGKPTGCLVVLGATNTTPSNRPVDLFLHNLRVDSAQDIRKRLLQGVADGELPMETDVGQLAAYFTTVLHGMSLQARDGATQEALQGVARTAMLIWPAPPSARRLAAA
ncbi:MAG: Bacterial regulatory s, tetR family protein [Collimonas fungivorans]|uniref:TetR/AcrR family transcriptional regulator n=1 Tax=Collimonas fungivorans TaxID=158899 RepID=UPI0026F2FA7F|nr:TetR/AcrR family transcriptional regulator [Collimonas fungivorans]MDB5766674.1 Bacterial regulatory s, tetR family protein [Collimonas fungivorans]